MGKGSVPRPFTDRAVFEDNFDKIFGKRIKEQKLNNDDMLPKYELDDGQLTDEQYANIKELAEYELNKSTGEVQKKTD